MTHSTISQRSSLCRDCPIGCHIRKDGTKKNKLAAYAALWGLDQSIEGFDEFVAAYHQRCDDIGLEAFETAAAIAVGIKAGRAAANVRGILDAVEEINRGTELGLILGNGAESAGRVWGLSTVRTRFSSNPAEVHGHHHHPGGELSLRGSRTEIGPRKSTGRSDAEDIFLDSTGLCAFAYSVMLADQDIWNTLDSLLKAKYGPSFDSEKLKNLAIEVERLEKA